MRGSGMRVTAVVLAGGQGRRMGGADKALVPLAGRPLLAHVLDRLRDQVTAVAVSANGDPARFSVFGVSVLPDPVPGQPGPLAGVLAGMRWAAALHADAVLSAPVDTPFLPLDLVPRLAAAVAGVPGARVAVAASGGQEHPPVALWDVALADTLEGALHAGERRVRAWAHARGAVVVHFPGTPDPFANLNTPDDLAVAEGRVA